MKRLYLFIFLFVSIFISSNNALAEPVRTQDIYSTIYTLPVSWVDRDNPSKQDQLYTIATAIEKATQQANWNDNDRTSLAAYLITIGFHESKFSIRIHKGVKRAYSYGLFQVTPQAHHVKREQLIGLSQEETDSSALIAAGAIAKSFGCGYSPADHFTAYYGGVPCKTDWRTLKQRVSTFYYVHATLIRFGKDD